MMDAAVNVASWVCLMVGTAFCIVGNLGLLRLPDVYSRTHAASITDTLGAGLFLLGLCFQGGWTLVTVKLVMIYGFMLYTGPAASHALVKAANAHGVKAAGVPEADHPGAAASAASAAATATEEGV